VVDETDRQAEDHDVAEYDDGRDAEIKSVVVQTGSLAFRVP